MPCHTHEFIEIVYIVSGTGVQCINDNEYTVCEGSCIIAAPGDVHSFSGDMTYYNIFLLPGFLSQEITNPAFPIFALSAFSELQTGISQSTAAVNFSDNKRKKVESILKSFFDEYNSSLSGRETSVQCYAILFLNEIYRHITQGGNTKYLPEVTIPEILKYIDIHYNEKLNLSELAQRCYYHPKYFSRVFKKYSGVTVSAYIQTLRLEHGQHLLKSTSLSIDDVAHEIGYSDSVSFYKSFKKAYGISPGEYRKNNQIL